MINLQRSLLGAIETTIQKIQTQGVGQRDAAKISPVLLQYLCQALFKDKVLSMSVESFKQGFLASWLKSIKSGSCTHPRMTVIVRNIQGHFFTVDLFWSQQRNRVFAFVIDSINQATTLEEEVRPGMDISTYIRAFGRGENAKNMQNTIQEDCETFGLQSTVSFVTNFPGEWQAIRQSQYDNGSCAFFSLYYALRLQDYTQENYAPFLEEVEDNFTHAQGIHEDNERYNYVPNYNREGNRALPLSWDRVPFSLLRPIQSKTGLRDLLRRRVEEEGGRLTRDFTKLLAMLDSGERNTFVIDFAKWVLEFGRLRLQRDVRYGQLDHIFAEDRWRSQHYMCKFLSAVSNTDNGSRFVEDWLVWLLQNPEQGLADRAQVSSWERYIGRFDLPEMNGIAITFDSEETGVKGFFDEDIKLRPLGQVLGVHLNTYLDEGGPVQKAKLPLAFILREANRKSICGSSGKIDKELVKAMAAKIASNTESRAEASNTGPSAEQTVANQAAGQKRVPVLHRQEEEPTIVGGRPRRAPEFRENAMSLTALSSFLAERGSGSFLRLPEESPLVRVADVTKSWPIPGKA